MRHLKAIARPLPPPFPDSAGLKLRGRKPNMDSRRHDKVFSDSLPVDITARVSGGHIFARYPFESFV
jgi:hypothetical protein